MKLFDLQGRMLQDVYLVRPRSADSLYFDVYVKCDGNPPDIFLLDVSLQTILKVFVKDYHKVVFV